jgi:Ca2+-binding EF-hand superfamily protein
VRACRRIFAVFDANGDGLLDFDELMRVSTRRVPL